MEKVWETSASRDTPSCRKGSSVTGRPEKVRVGGGGGGGGQFYDAAT